MRKARVTGVSTLWAKVPEDNIYEVYSREELLAMDNLSDGMLECLEEYDEHEHCVGWVLMEVDKDHKGLAFTEVFDKDVEWMED